MKLVIIFLLFIPFYEGQFVDGIRKIVGSPVEAFIECQKADTYQAMPNGSKYARLFKINLKDMTVEEVKIPESITVKRT